MNVNSEKIDLYSIPVFLLEILVLIGLTLSAYYIHFQYKHEPILSGFYCDDVSLRHEFHESKLVEQFTRPDNELVVLALLVAVPIVVIIFCELVNSMFGSLKFRQIRALCKCCKLHSITRRTIRFSGAYILGFLFVMISCNIIANTTGRLKPYFAQECPQAFKDCLKSQQTTSSNSGTAAALTSWPHDQPTAASQLDVRPPKSIDQISQSDTESRPLSAPIMQNNSSSIVINNLLASTTPAPIVSVISRARRQANSASGDALVDKRILERQWIILSNVDLTELCQFKGDSIQTRKFERLAMSWPSFPASIVTYACVYIACYLCFVGTARPFRIITSVLVVTLLLIATIFNVQLVKEHFNHWDDTLAGAVLSVMVVVFVLYVYLNKFKDVHYYENQKIHKRRSTNTEINGYSNDVELEQYGLDKTEDLSASNGANMQGNTDSNGSIPNNDLAMRYFQIPRANYRGAPRPLSSAANQM